MIISVVLTVMLLIFINPIVAVMDTPKEAVKGITDYLIVCFIGIPFITAYNVISSVFRGLGDSKSPMYFIAVACGLNIALDYIFIGACGMGPLGAALGTTLAQTFSVIISFVAIKRMNTGLRLTKMICSEKICARRDRKDRSSGGCSGRLYTDSIHHHNRHCE